MPESNSKPSKTTIPEVISKVSGLVKSKKKPNKSSDDLNTDEKA